MDDTDSAPNSKGTEVTCLPATLFLSPWDFMGSFRHDLHHTHTSPLSTHRITY